jgi:hypothetical protein
MVGWGRVLRQGGYRFASRWRALPHPSVLGALRPVLAIVSRDRQALFSALKGRLEPEYGRVIWDRRGTQEQAGEGLVPAEPREADRRGAPPTSWEVWGFLLVRPAAPAA